MLHFFNFACSTYSVVNKRWVISFAAEWLASLFQRHLYLGTESKGDVEKVLDKPDFDSVVKYMKSGRCKNIITLAGAGISTCKFWYLFKL